MADEKKVKVKGKPLNDRDRKELDKIKIKDVQEAVIEAHPEMKSFFRAQQR